MSQSFMGVGFGAFMAQIKGKGTTTWHKIKPILIKGKYTSLHSMQECIAGHPQVNNFDSNLI